MPFDWWTKLSVSFSPPVSTTSRLRPLERSNNSGAAIIFIYTRLLTLADNTWRGVQPSLMVPTAKIHWNQSMVADSKVESLLQCSKQMPKKETKTIFALRRFRSYSSIHLSIYLPHSFTLLYNEITNSFFTHILIQLLSSFFKEK